MSEHQPDPRVSEVAALIAQSEEDRFEVMPAKMRTALIRSFEPTAARVLAWMDEHHVQRGADRVDALVDGEPPRR